MYMTGKLKQKVTRAQGWKKKLSETLKDLGLINEDFTGKILVDLNQGGVRNLDKTEQLK